MEGLRSQVVRGKALCVTTLTLMLTLVFAASAAAASGIEAWTEYDGHAGISARVVTHSASCPTIRFTVSGRRGSQPLHMGLRALPEGSGERKFDDHVCQAQLHPGTTSATVGGQQLALPAPNPTRIVIIGDTGCRIKKGRAPQACNNPTAWPFAKIARLAAAEHPQLVIHMGDEHYREQPCPSGPEGDGCHGVPWGYNSAANRAEFFEPARPLLAAAPWVFVRGDHENCKRNGIAWFRYWAAGDDLAHCSDYTDPYKVSMGERSLLIFDDSASIEQFPVTPEEHTAFDAQQAIYRRQWHELERMATGPSWFLTHKPLWGIKPGKTVDSFERTNPAIQSMTDNELPANVDLTLAGDLHLFEALTFEHQRVPQLVIGNGGDQLAGGPQPALPGLALPVGVDAIRAGRIIQQFGYTVWTREPGSSTWHVTLKDQNGHVTLRCVVANSTTTCSRPGPLMMAPWDGPTS